MASNLDLADDTLEISVSPGLRADLEGTRQTEESPGTETILLEAHQLLAAVERSTHGLLYHPLIPKFLFRSPPPTPNQPCKKLEDIKLKIASLATSQKFAGVCAIVAGKLFEGQICLEAMTTVVSSVIYALAMVDEKTSTNSLPLAGKVTIQHVRYKLRYAHSDNCMAYSEHAHKALLQPTSNLRALPTLKSSLIKS